MSVFRNILSPAKLLMNGIFKFSWLVLTLVLGASLIPVERVAAEEMKINETGAFQNLGDADDRFKQEALRIGIRWGGAGRDGEITFRSPIVEARPKGTWAPFSSQAFLYDEEGKPKHPLYVEIKYQDNIPKPARLYSRAGGRGRRYLGVLVANLGGKNDNQWRKETFEVKDILAANGLYSFVIDTSGCINLLPIASIRVFMKVEREIWESWFRPAFDKTVSLLAQESLLSPPELEKIKRELEEKFISKRGFFLSHEIEFAFAKASLEVFFDESPTE